MNQKVKESLENTEAYYCVVSPIDGDDMSFFFMESKPSKLHDTLALVIKEKYNTELRHHEVHECFTFDGYMLLVYKLCEIEY